MYRNKSGQVKTERMQIHLRNWAIPYGHYGWLEKEYQAIKTLCSRDTSRLTKLELKFQASDFRTYFLLGIKNYYTWMFNTLLQVMDSCTQLDIAVR